MPIGPVQLKLYLQARRSQRSLRIGQMPPHGIEIDDAPDEFDAFIDVLSEPVTPAEAGLRMDGSGGANAEEWTSLVHSLIEAGVVGPPIASDSRYARHLLYFDLIGLAPQNAQARLRDACVGVVGTGGIGTNVATVLATAGVGRLVLTDGDRVETSNLTRQYLFDENTVGELKVEAAARRLAALNSSTKIDVVPASAHQSLFLDQLRDCDVVVVSADSPDLLHEWADAGAREHGYAYLAAGYIEGHGSVGPLVIPGTTACLSCMERQTEPGDLGPNLNRGLQAASYGPLNLLVAAIAANEVIRLLSGATCETSGRRILIDSQSYAVTWEDFERDASCDACCEVTPRPEWSVAHQRPTLEDVYDAERDTTSISVVILDEEIVRLAQVRTGDRVLDFGCGTGEQACAIAAATGATVTAYDISARMLDLLGERLTTGLHGRQVRVARTLSQAQDDGPFDLVVCTNVLDHIDDVHIADTLTWLRQQLASDGRAIITVPHPMKDGAAWIRRSGPHGWDYQEARLGDYFTEGPIAKPRVDANGVPTMRSIQTYHRTLETYARLLRDTGLSIEDVREPQPGTDVKSSFPDLWDKASRMPYFLTFTLRPSA